MFNNYTLKGLLLSLSSQGEKHKDVKSTKFGFTLGVVLMLLFASIGIQAQTTIINPAGDGGFNNGSTFAANGWTVANQGVNPSKWVVGTGVSTTTTASTASVVSGTTTLTLTAGNPLIYPGMKVTASSGVLAANTYVSAISGTTLTLTNATTAASATAVTLTFGFGSNGGAVGTSATVTSASTTITLTAANPAIVVGQSVTVTSITNVLAANTYVTNVSGATITLSQPTIAASTAVTFSFGSTSSNISGNAAYVSNDGGASNAFFGFNGTRTIYFYRDVTVSSAEKAMTLTFDVKSPIASSAGGWQVWVAPTSQSVLGTDTQVTSAFTNTAVWPGATLITFNHAAQVGTTKQTAFIPPSFAGTTFRLIFVWTNTSSAAALPPAAIDNISLVSRVGTDINSTGTGLWSNPSIWDVAVPTPADNVTINDNRIVTIDCKNAGVFDLSVVNAAGSGATLQWGNTSTLVDTFTVYDALTINGSGARFNIYEGGLPANGKKLNVASDINLLGGGRLDASSSNSVLNLNGSTLQTVSVDSSSFIGGTNATTTTANTLNVMGNLQITNTSTATPNISWQANNVKINTKFLNSTGRISLGTNKITIGNYSGITETPIAGTGFIGGTVSKWINGSYTTVVPTGVDFPFGIANSYGTIYQLLDSNGKNRWMLVYPDAAPATAGEVAVTYTDATTVTTGLSVTDGSYSINNRYDGNWTIATPNSNTSGTGAAITFTPNATTNTFRIGAYATGGYVAKDGTSRIMSPSAALAGTHQDGTTTPFVFRTGIPFSSVTAAPLYVGTGSSSMVSISGAVTSATTGAWTSGSTWVGGVVPTACQTVIIASGHTVTVSGTAVAGNIFINNGATLVNASGSLTVGCSGNNSALENYGTYTCSGGTVTVNGYVAHRVNSYFNHTGGNIIVDGNDNGNVATSVGFGGSIFKIETSNLNLTGGKITIVDPLVNSNTPITSTSLGQFTLNTEGATGTFSYNTNGSVTASGSTTLTMATNNYCAPFFTVGQSISGTGIVAGTTITSVTIPFATPGSITLTISNPTNASIPANTPLNFPSMYNGINKLVLAANSANANLAVGDAVTGTGIPSGTTISSIAYYDSGTSIYLVTLSQNISGLSTSPITSAQSITFDAVNPGAYAAVLTTANASIIPGMIVTGTGLLDGTYVADVNGTVIMFSQPIQAGAPTTLSLSFYPKNFESSGAFVYDSPNNYAAGLGHTLQIGDGSSTQKGAVLTYGFNCVFQKYGVGGMLSLGNLIVDAPDGANRYMNSMTGPGNNGNCNMNVQGDFTITAGSVFKKHGASSTIYVGGNLINNGSFLTGLAGITLTMGNFSNGFCVPSTIAQTISGSGTFSNNIYTTLSTGYPGSISSLNINNTSTSGVTLNVAGFRVQGGTLTNGILHTSSSYPLLIGDFTGGGQVAISTSTTPGGSGVPLAGTPRYVEGPIQVIIPTSASGTQFKAFPLGKNGKFLPLQIVGTGGVELLAEAFDTNSGTVTSNASNLSSNRWKVTRVGTTGAFSSYNVQLGNSDVTASNILVQASSDQGAYDVFTGDATVYNPAVGFGLPYDTPTKTNTPVLQLTTALTTGYTGYFSYAQGPACSGTPTPGNTVASTSSVCGGAPTTLSLQNATAGANVTYQWQISTNGTTFSNISGATAATYVAYPTVNSSYLCKVSCSAGTPVASTPVAITISNTNTPPTVTGATVCNSGVASLTASGAATLTWFDAPTNGSVLATGATYAPTVSATTTYYVSSNTVSSASAGQTTPTGTSTATTNFKGLSFDAKRAFKLKTVTVYPKNTVAALTPITIRLYDNTGNIVAGTSDVTFTPTVNTGTANSVSQTVTLNYTVPVGTGYRLVAAYGMGASNALGTSTATQTYPAVYSSFTINGNVSDLSSAPATTANAYNCFFNITIDENCETARTPVTATVLPLVTYYQDADGDGYGNAAVSQQACTQPSGYVTNNTDCNDADATKNASYTFYVDADHDTYGTGSLVSVCAVNSTTPPTGYSVNNTDCDDTNAAVWQTGSFYVDADGDGYTVGSPVSVCYGASTPTGYSVTSAGTDCNDADATVTTGTNITTQPSNPTICNVTGASATASVVAAGAPTLAYQWYMQTGTQTTWTTLANNANYSGVTSATLTITRSSATVPATATRYHVIVSGGTCTNATSSTIILQQLAVAAKATAITAVTKLTPALTTCSGSSVTLSLAAGSIGNIQWQSSTDGTSWTNVGTAYSQTAISAANPALTFVTGALTTATYFRVVATNGACGSVDSTTPIHIFVSTPPTTGTISGGNVTVCAPVSTGFDATGAALTAPITNSTTLSLDGVSLGATIAWQKCINYTATTPTWTAITGATNGTLTVTNLAANTWYRALVTNGACSAYSGVVSITVTKPAKAGVTTCAASVCYGFDILLTSATYTGDAIQWQISTTSATTGFSNISGATTSPYTLAGVTYAPLSKFYIRSMVTSGSCTAAYSAVKTITVNPLSVAGTVRGGGTVCSSGLAGTLAVAGNTGTIQWQYSTDGGTTYVNAPSSTGTASTFTTTSTGTAATYIVSNVTADTYFRVLVTSGACSSAASNAVSFVVGTAATAGTVSAVNTTVCTGTGTTLTLSGSVGAIVWQKSVSPFTAWTNVTTSVTPTLNTGNLTATTQYRASVTIGGCSTVTTTPVTITVPSAPLAKPITANLTSPTGASGHGICLSSSTATKILTIGTGSIGAIQWQYSTTSATAGFIDINGQNGTSYTVSSPVAGANYYRASFTNTCGVTVYNTAFAVYYNACLTDGGSTAVVAKDGTVPFGVTVAPNPFTENFNLNLTTSSEATVGIRVYDMLGKLIDQRDMNPSEVSGLQIGDRFPSGVYIITVTQGSDVTTLRAVKR